MLQNLSLKSISLVNLFYNFFDIFSIDDEEKKKKKSKNVNLFEEEEKYFDVK